jgi:sec-independent protein translocase protein TatA
MNPESSYLVGRTRQRGPAADDNRRPPLDHASMANIGPTELIIVLVVALLILGPKRLPAAARSVGQGIREFKDSLAGHGGSDAVEELPPSSYTKEASAAGRQQASPAER